MKRNPRHDLGPGGLLLLAFLLILNGLPAIFAAMEKSNVHGENEPALFRTIELTAFHRMTLGLPISINQESAEGLTAVPGIGPKTAGLIVHERIKRGRFQRLDDLKSIKGIGTKLFEKMKPFLEL